MRHKLLGRSGLRVSELCLGTMTFGGGNARMPSGSTDEESRQMFDMFAEAGGTFVDTARAYGRGLGAAGLTALMPARRLNPAGSSFHAGATLPMARTPGPGQSDTLGRPHGLAHLHLVDASCLPAIPATTITLSVMANAHRIGSRAP